jgi:hypothetical protein
MENIEKKERTAKRCTAKKESSTGNRAAKRNTTSGRRSTSSSASSTEDEEIDLMLVSTDEEDSENDAQCLYCRYFFSEDKRGEKWVCCTKCDELCHEECAGEREDWTYFTCGNCIDG